MIDHLCDIIKVEQENDVETNFQKVMFRFFSFEPTDFLMFSTYLDLYIVYTATVNLLGKRNPISSHISFKQTPVK